MAANRRLQKEAKDIALNPPEGCSAAPINSNVYKWEATICGPKDTPYEGGIFRLSMDFPQNYPFSAPKVKFLTKIYHSNVDSHGSICLDILKDQWSPVLQVSQLLVSITSLLSEPNHNDPLNPSAANLFRSNKKEYEETIKEYVIKYAS